MKKSALFLILLCICLFLCGCAEKDYVKATGGDFSVSLPNGTTEESSNQSSSATVSAEEEDFVGVWKLNSIADNGSTITYNNSYYIFNEDGSYSLAIDGQTNSGRFSVKDDILYLGNTPLVYTMKDEALTLLTKNGKTHKLTKIEQDD